MRWTSEGVRRFRAEKGPCRRVGVCPFWPRSQRLWRLPAWRCPQPMRRYRSRGSHRSQSHPGQWVSVGQMDGTHRQRRKRHHWLHRHGNPRWRFVRPDLQDNRWQPNARSSVSAMGASTTSQSGPQTSWARVRGLILSRSHRVSPVSRLRSPALRALVCQCQLDRSGHKRKPHHPLHGDFESGCAGLHNLGCDPLHRDRSHQRQALHLQGDRHQRPWHRAPSAPSPSVTPLGQTIPVGNDPWRRLLGRHPRLGGELGSNTVTELNASTGSVVQTIPVGSGSLRRLLGRHPRLGDEPRRQHGDRAQRLDRLGGPDHPRGQQSHGVSSDGTHVWVANRSTDTVTELDASTGALVQTIPWATIPRRLLGRHPRLGGEPADEHGDRAGRLDRRAGPDHPRGQRVPTASPRTAPTSGWRTGSTTRSPSWTPRPARWSRPSPWADHPYGVSSDGTHVWVANTSDNTVTELNASDGSVVQTIPWAATPYGVSSDGTHVWVTNSYDNTVSEFPA